jgi:hypothetical protein
VSAITGSPAIRAREMAHMLCVLALEDYYAPDSEPIPVSVDAGSFHPAPLGVLIGLPALTSRTLRARTYQISVHVISADPVNTLPATESLLALADALVIALGLAAYSPTDWSGGVNRDPLPSVHMLVTVTVTEEE